MRSLTHWRTSLARLVSGLRSASPGLLASAISEYCLNRGVSGISKGPLHLLLLNSISRAAIMIFASNIRRTQVFRSSALPKVVLAIGRRLEGL